MKEGFPENHDNPSVWPYWSPSHRRIQELAAEHLPKMTPRSDPRTREDTHTIEAFERNDQATLESMLTEIDEEVELLQSSLAAVLHQRKLLAEALAARKR